MQRKRKINASSRSRSVRLWPNGRPRCPLGIGSEVFNGEAGLTASRSLASRSVSAAVLWSLRIGVSALTKSSERVP